MTSADKVTRFSTELFDDATAVGAKEQRSARQQLEYWARVGRSVSEQSSISRRRIESALAGTLPSEHLTADESVVFDAEIEATIEADLAKLDVVPLRSAGGFTSVALNDRGELVEYRADGSEHIIAGE